ncbi:MAG: Rha family transcriptional regulator [Oscillospiraceae bacterium]|nr:Rha family transcriptional regulator [Oscillospiraceae bacterium]
MNTLTLINFNGIETVDSRQVAEVVEKEHSKLLRDIRTYCDYLNEAKIGLVDFFIESIYTDSKGEERPCYLCTRKGCEMIANKLTGQKGVAFTALYINAFHEMEEHIKQTERIKNKAKTLEIEEINAKIKLSNQYLRLSKTAGISKAQKQVLFAKLTR